MLLATMATFTNFFFLEIQVMLMKVPKSFVDLQE